MLNTLKSRLPYSLRGWINDKLLPRVKEEEADKFLKNVKHRRAILFCTYDDWSSVPQRYHHIARWVQKMDVQVFFGTRKRIDRFKGQFKLLNNGVLLYNVDPVSFARLLLKRGYQLWIYNYYPYWSAKFVGRDEWPGVHTIYDLLDHPEIFKNASGYTKALKDIKLSIENSELVICISEQLKNWAVNNGAKRCKVIENGVDEIFFRRSPGIPREIKMIKEKGFENIIMFHGVMGEWVDFRLLKKIIKMMPSVAFLLAGNDRCRVVRKEIAGRFNNVFYPGWINYNQLPDFLYNVDAGLIPFKVTETGLFAAPMKLLEYFACGVPVVSSENNFSRQMGAIIASGSEDFVEKLKISFNTGESEKKRLVELAKNYTWQKVAKKFLGLLEHV